MSTTTLALARSVGNYGGPSSEKPGDRYSGQGCNGNSGAGGWSVPPPNDREKLKQSFIFVFMEHPVITLLVVILIGAVVFSDLLN